MLTRQSISPVLENPPNVSIGEVLKESNELLKENLGMFIGVFVVFICVGLVFLGISTGLMAIGIPSVQFIINIIQWVVNTTLTAGLIIMVNKVYKKQETSLSDLFSGYKYLGPLFGSNIVTGIFVVIGFVVLIIPGIYLVVAYSFTTLIIVSENVEFYEAMEISRKVITKRWFEVFVFFIVLFFINVLGILALGIGLLYTAPLSYIAFFIFYKKCLTPVLDSQGDLEDKIYLFGQEEKDINTESQEGLV